jgi:protoheme IX farnesyltransferase
VLIPVSLAPVLLHRAGVLYLAGAVLLGCYFGSSALAFLRTRSVPQARRVLRASLVYLPALLALLLLEGLTGPAATDLWQ